MTESAASWTAEQREAIERRAGGLFLDAAAGSGKTSVLVERFVRDVLEDGVAVSAILAITFTEKAAAEMRERIRARLRELGAIQAARDAESAAISTIHGFCARVLRAHALEAGLDPGFSVLEEGEAQQLADAAFEAAIEELAESAEGAELIAGYGIWDLRAAIRSVHAQLRSRGELRPRLPAVGAGADLEAARRRVISAGVRALAELGAVSEPSARVVSAIERLQRITAVVEAPLPWPGDLDGLRLPGGNGAALRTQACLDYGEALAALREACADHAAARTRDVLDRLLAEFGTRYGAAKRARSGLDFEDLELLCLELLRSRPELRERYRERFQRVMVDELQDTNSVQLALVDSVAGEHLFTVGDAQQSIYAFRHADVKLFERRGEEHERAGARSTLSSNFRSRPEILDVLNRVFADALGERFVPLVAGRGAAGGNAGERVELLIVDRGADQDPDCSPELDEPGPPASWRVTEASMLAGRVGELIAGGASPRDVVVLTRASTEIRVYERALEERGIPTYVIGGRGYWSHPQVIDIVAYLRVLANPRDEEALYTVLASPLVGVSYDTLVLLAAAAREGSRDPWWVVREPTEGALEETEPADRARLEWVAEWIGVERGRTARSSVPELIERVLERTGYDLAVLGLPGGRRRLANVRKLMRLGREYAADHGPDLRGFLDLCAERARRPTAGEEENEAPVEGEALDAVRLMTIHRAKGLEFEIVCVADLGRLPRWGGDVVRVGADGRLGLRLARPGTGRREPALAYEALGDEQRDSESREERRLFYVAATRARERLIFSAAADVGAVWGGSPGAAPIGWLGPGLVPDLPGLLARGEDTWHGVRVRVQRGRRGAAAPVRRAVAPTTRPPAELPSPAPTPTASTTLSYTALAEYGRCGYRFYAERVLGLPAVDVPASGTRGATPGRAGGELTAVERGIAVHGLLELLDFRRGALPDDDAIATAAGRNVSAEQAAELRELVERFAQSELGGRLRGAARLRREQAFGFVLADRLITGALDVIADVERGLALVVDYKSDRLEHRTPAEAVLGYAIQRAVYGLAALRAGYAQVEVAHVFLERPGDPALVRYSATDADGLVAELEPLILRVAGGEYRVTDTPHRALCSGCPAEGGLCSWPLAMTRRDGVDRLF